MNAYHTALSADDVSCQRRSHWRGDEGVAFVHDAGKGLPQPFRDVGVVYGEPPWADGYDEFNRRAGRALAPPYQEWLFGVAKGLIENDRPFVAVGGRWMLRCLPCEWVTPIGLNGSTACLIGAGLPEIRAKTTAEVCEVLADRFTSIGDWCAGYGNALRPFVRRGKPFVASDINAKCIGYIAQHAPTWPHV